MFYFENRKLLVMTYECSMGLIRVCIFSVVVVLTAEAIKLYFSTLLAIGGYGFEGSIIPYIPRFRLTSVMADDRVRYPCYEY